MPGAIPPVSPRSSRRPAAIRIRCTRSWKPWRPTERELSPTRFHNSVHNAPAGYWSIATQSREPSTSLCRDDESFQAALLEAAAASRDRSAGRGADRLRPALSRAAGRCPPDCRAVRHRPSPDAGTDGTDACPPGHRAVARTAAEPTRMADPALGELCRTGNPAGPGLPLLAALAGGMRPTTIVLHSQPAQADHHSSRAAMLMTRDDIAALIPHSGPMCLLDDVLPGTRTSISCRRPATGYPDNPLRSKRTSRGGLRRRVCRSGDGPAWRSDRWRQRPAAGYLASIRDLACLSDGSTICSEI